MKAVYCQKSIYKPNLKRRVLPLAASLLFAGVGPLNAVAGGIYGNGVSASSMSMAGADVAWAADPLSAMTENPAGLGFLDRPEIDLGAVGGWIQGSFNKPGVSSGSLADTLQALPDGAIGFPLKKWPVTFGLSIAPQSALLADWHYNDPPGGLGGLTSYGYQQDKSEILLLRSALGAAVKINSKFSFGASVGLLYNENELVAPYIFQNLQPATVNGAKTLLNLHTTGFGADATAGMIFRATTNLQFGLFYQSESVLNTSGDASGDPYAQFGVQPGPLAFHYDAEVKNKFPQMVSAGASWQFHPQWRAALQVDWVDWADAFNTLHVSLSQGSNPTVDTVLGSSFKDNVPLDWQSEFVYRAGLEYDVTKNLALRLGYCYGPSPVPDSTLTPMTAAINEHIISAGAGYHWRNFSVSLAYQYYIPATQNVGVSGLRSSEYSGTSTTVSAHLLAITTSITF
jgi:long-chain fatty acid transport protein